MRVGKNSFPSITSTDGDSSYCSSGMEGMASFCPSPINRDDEYSHIINYIVIHKK